MNAQTHADGAEIDRRLEVFFKGEVPQPWPAAPVTSHVEAHVDQTLARSPSPSSHRIVLAVSIAMLTLIGVALTGRMPIPPRHAGPSVDTGTATVPKPLR